MPTRSHVPFRRSRWSAVLVAALAGSSMALSFAGCDLFRTMDAENVSGRGAKAFDPYAGPRSGAIRLALQQFNGCAIFATGERVGKGGGQFPYPDDCATGSLFKAQPATPAGSSARPIPLLTGTTYFLGQFMTMDALDNVHTDPTDLSTPMSWIRQQSRLKNLDWTGFGIIADEVIASEKSIVPYAFDRRVRFGNAAWQLKRDDTFLLEVLDADGTPRTSITYTRNDFFAENPVAGHSQLAWHYGPIGPPSSPGSLTINPVPTPPPSFPPVDPVSYDTFVRFEMMGTTHPEKTFQIDSGLIGDGAIRVTWSQLPNEPFYFPVTFVKPEDLPLDCYDPADPANKVRCTFGLEPHVTFSRQANQTFYEPGERFEVTLSIADGAGNLLHPPDKFFSWKDFIEGNANGLLYFNLFSLYSMHERDTIMGIGMSGPLQNVRPLYELGDSPFLQLQSFVEGSTETQGLGFQVIPSVVASLDAVAGGKTSVPPTTYRFKVPDDAPPGTYALIFKTHRQFMGERFTKAFPFYFQVGQAEKTRLPGRIGNCQLCHRGVISLDNVRHGLPVDFVEGCKTCHNRADYAAGDQGQTMHMIHRLHMLSTKYPRPKNDCATCHLTRESTLRPSYLVCSSCHPTLHPGQFDQLENVTDRDPTLPLTQYSSCANGCHVLTPPASHLLPEL